MRGLGKQSLNRKLTLVVITAVMTAVLVIAVGAVWQEARRHTDGKVDYLNATAAVFGSATSQAVADGDAEAAMFALRGVARAPHLLYARVSTPDGRVLADIGSGVSLGTDARYDSDAGDRNSLLATLRSRTIEVSRPIIQGGRMVGRIRLVADNSDLLPSLLVTLLQTLLGAATALGVAVLIAARLQRWVVRPLLTLTNTVRAIAESHDYSTRVDIETDDEVGELCGGFNVMLSEIKDRERKIIDLALHDPETDLPNRLSLEREIAAHLAGSRQRKLAVVAMGVDRFQYVRGIIGYHRASDLLGELGARAISADARGAPARISTDALAFIVEADTIEAAQLAAGRVLAAAEQPISLGSDTIEVNLTMGIALFGECAGTPQRLVELANIALDQARAGHVKIAAFDEAAYVSTASNLSLMSDMLRALENGQIAIHVQPKFDIRRGLITGGEVLTRWRHPTRGAVPPELFIGMAEETGAILPLTHWTLRQTILCQERLAAERLEPALAVNLSGRLLSDAEFIAAALPLLEQARHQIYLEITETATIDNQERALRHIEALLQTGARISIDDYGSGLSSLAYLKRIPAQELKIDKAFVQLLGEKPRDALLVKSTIDLAHSLGMSVTAEGVETEASFAALAAMGCDTIQGYLIAKPMPVNDYVRFLREEAPLAMARFAV